MAVNSTKYITNTLVEFLLLTVEPNSVLKSAAVKSLHSVVVCYDVQHFYRTRKCFIDTRDVSIGLDEFQSYCDSKVFSKCGAARQSNGYHCLMTVGELIKLPEWAGLYAVVGPAVMKFLLFDCLLFVPHRENVYFCVDSSSGHCGRHEVLQAFRSMSKFVWKDKSRKSFADNRTHAPKCYKISDLFKNIKKPGQMDAAAMLTEIRQTDVGGSVEYGQLSFEPLRKILEKLSARDSRSAYKHMYYSAIDGHRSQAIPLGRIKKFAATVVRKIVPVEMFGTAGNRDQYQRNVSKILDSGMGHEFTVEHVVHKIKTSRAAWLRRVVSPAGTGAMAKTLTWLTNAFVFGRITQFFQVVTTNVPSYGIAYFAKPTWTSMYDRTVQPLTESGFFQEVRPQTAAVVARRNWRVCPFAKLKGIRLIFKLNREPRDKALMNDCLVFLRCLANAYPRTKSVDKSKFFESWQSMRVCLSKSKRPVYYVRTDFRDAFTSIKQQPLLAVLRSSIKRHFGAKSQELYMNTVDVVKWASGATVYCKKMKYFDGLPPPKFPDGALLFHDKSSIVSLNRIWNAVKTSVEGNAVTLHRRPMAMLRGIIQGDRLSTMLCDILLADLQSNQLKSCVSGPSRLLYRYMDDYLFVSFDRRAAEHFLATMSAGFEKYGLTINKDKTETNLYGTTSDGGGSVRFLGLRVHVDTGEITRDEQVFRGKRPLHFFDYGLAVRPGKQLYRRVTSHYHYPLPIVLFSKTYNSPATVVRNLASVVAHKAFGVVTSAKQYFWHANPAFLWRLVRDVSNVVYAKMCSLRQHCAITPAQGRWIVYEVFKKMLHKYLPTDTVWVIDQLRANQAKIESNSNVLTVKKSLRFYDFTKMFD
ncbi:telomerase reverse transcriptase-like [Adelges cooleyi]|uniref:telomerase reverse transcriptase-like n=1 Tax=Adelges cooleyi TaxID=133065 RepID=UPI00217F9FA7|nr:telomerase reverse transcriptase-like [Adelges cooleyi]XP_050428233.1 telomerase reverse transcriptase-like [Adelges cooleyi]